MLPRALAAAAKLSSRQTAAAAALRTHSHTPALRPTAATIRAGAASDATPYAHTTSFLLSARRSYASKSPSNDGTVPPGGDSSPAATTNKQAQTEKTQPQGTGTAASDSSAASHDATTTTQSQPAQPPPPPPTGDSAAAATEQANPFLQDLKNMPLPDLTKGLPSTIFSELEQQKKRGRPGLPNLTEDPDLSAEYDPTNANAAAGAGGAGKGSAGGSGGDGSGPEYVSSTDQRREKMASVSYAFFWTGAAGVALYLGRNWASAEEEHAHPDAPSG
ncbi:mitochondrial inner membrane protein required for protein import, partial [Ascosphaera acerosa]